MARSFTDFDGHRVQLMAAEVLEVIYNSANPALIYGVRVKLLNKSRIYDDQNSQITASPLNFNCVRIPIVGELVLLINAASSFGSSGKFSTRAYYLDIISLQSSIHHNALPRAAFATPEASSEEYSETSSGDTATEPADPTIDANFIEKEAAGALQPYVGDVILQGRYGNSIRFTTTPEGPEFEVAPKFSEAPGAPITIFRNSAGTNGNLLTTEDFTNEDNVIVMASGQRLEFEQASSVLSSAKSKKITSWSDEGWGTTPQTLISSGRIIFNSTQKEIIAFAKNGIALSSATAITIDATDNVSINATKIELGTDSDEPLILGNVWKKWTEDLLDAIGTIKIVGPTGIAAPINTTVEWPKVEVLIGKLDTLLSEVSFTKKKPNTSGEGGNSTILDFTLTEEELAEKKQQQEEINEVIEDGVEYTFEQIEALKDVYNALEQEIKTVESLFKIV